MSAKKEYVKLTKEERATVLKSMSLLIKEGVQASDIVRQYSHLASRPTLFRWVNDANDMLKVMHPMITPTTHKLLTSKIEETAESLAQILSNKDRTKMSKQIIDYFKEDINRPILNAGEQIPNTNLTILPSDELMQRKGRRDAINELIKILHLDDLIYKSMLETAPPPTNEEFEKVRKQLKV